MQNCNKLSKYQQNLGTLANNIIFYYVLVGAKILELKILGIAKAIKNSNSINISVIIKNSKYYQFISRVLLILAFFTINLENSRAAGENILQQSFANIGWKKNPDQIYKNYPELNKVDHLLLLDQDSGEILIEKKSAERIAPSSMTKLMTAYVVFDEVSQGKIQLNNQCLIGKDAWRKKGSTMFLNHGDVVSIDDLLRGLIVVSGNDSSIALAQSISGSVKSFAKLMNKTAKRIGLKNSNFKNPHGLNERNHYMTLADLGVLTKRIAKDFPQFMHYFSTKEFSYGGIKQKNRNPLIRNSYDGATGMKTGYTTDGGYGVVGTASRSGRNLIGVVNNTLTPGQRKRAIMELLDYGFENFEKITFFDQNEIVFDVNVWLGQKDKVSLITKDDIAISLKNDLNSKDVEFEVKYKDPIFAPVKKGQEAGKLIIKNSESVLREIPLYAQEEVKKAGYFSRMFRVLSYKTENFLR